VVGLWDTQYAGAQTTDSPCPADFDFLPGGSFTVQIDGFTANADGCKPGGGKVVQGPGDWTWVASGNIVDCGDRFFCAALSQRHESCSGSGEIEISAGKIPSGKAVLGQYPPASVYRRFGAPPDMAFNTCLLSHTPCADRYVAEIEEL
jgi:hypothetical protein